MFLRQKSEKSVEGNISPEGFGEELGLLEADRDHAHIGVRLRSLILVYAVAPLQARLRKFCMALRFTKRD